MLPSRIFFDNMLDDFKFEERMKCDIYEKKGVYHIEADIPGFSKDDIKLELNRGNLIITAEKEEKEEEKDKNTVLWVLAIIGAVAAVAGIAFAVYRFFAPDYLEDFEEDFDDDFDDYFEDEEE